MSAFVISPIELAMDPRLSKNELRVMLALLSFRNKNTQLVWPSRDKLAAIVGLPVGKISTITTGLVTKGWLKKQGNGGRSKSVRYEVCVPEFEPETVTDSVTVPETETVTEIGTKTVTDSVTKTVTDSVTGIEQTSEQTKEQTNINGRKCAPSERKPEKKSPPRKTKIPDDFVLTLMRAEAAQSYWASKNRQDLIPSTWDEFDKFRNHHVQHGKTMACWESAWRTWYTNAVRFNRPPPGLQLTAATRQTTIEQDLTNNSWAEIYNT